MMLGQKRDESYNFITTSRLGVVFRWFLSQFDIFLLRRKLTNGDRWWMNTSVLVVNGDFSLKTITAAAVAVAVEPVVVVVEVVVVVVVAVRVMNRTDRENICSDVN
jgi:hypothetical protein